MSRHVLVLSGFLLFAPNVSPAHQNAGAEFLELFGVLDGNNDQVIERDEVPEKGRAAFDRLLKVADASKDGKLELQEYREALRKGRDALMAGGLDRPEGAPTFEAMDANGDGKVSRDEFRGPGQIFDRLDTDSDGSVSMEEARRFRGAGAAGGGEALNRLKAMDADGDGKVSRDEFRGPAPLFDRLDRNQDGVIEEQEARVFRPAARPALKKASGTGNGSEAPSETKPKD